MDRRMEEQQEKMKREFDEEVKKKRTKEEAVSSIVFTEWIGLYLLGSFLSL